MADSFQNEVPKAPVNLKPGLHTGGASKKTGLPLKLLVAGDLTVKNTLADDGSEDNISLTFQSMKYFTPEQVSRQTPQLHLLYPALAGGCES